MKIRTQFSLLIAGTVVLPILMILGVVALEFYRSPEHTLVPGYQEIREVAGVQLDPSTWKDVTRKISRTPNEVQLLVLSSELNVLFSTMEEYSSGVSLSRDELLELMNTSGQKYLYQFDNTGSSPDNRILVISRISQELMRDRNPIVAVIRVVIAVFLFMIIFSAVMSYLIARSVTKSVLTLESATKRIAAGQLDVSVDARGSNEITSLTESLNRMRLTIKEEESRRSRFIMGVGHDLKTPLALIKGYSEAIADGIVSKPEEVRKSLGIIGSKVDQLEGMIDDLIGFVKLDTGEWRQHLQKIALGPLVRAYARRMEADAAVLDRVFLYESSLDDGIEVSLDQRLFTRAMDNIVSNAIRYTRGGGVIRLSLEREGPGAVIRVRDDGCGIQSEDLPRVFDLFFRGTNSRREEGMGLGLAVVKTICDSHGWEVRVSSVPGESTIFEIFMPISEFDR